MSVKYDSYKLDFECQTILTAEIIKSWIVCDLGEGKKQPAHRILRGRLSRKTYLLCRFSIILKYFWKSEKSKHGPSEEFQEIKGVDRQMHFGCHSISTKRKKKHYKPTMSLDIF